MIAALAANLFATGLSGASPFSGAQPLPEHFRVERLQPKHPDANTPPAPVNSARPQGTHPAAGAEVVSPVTLDPRPFWQHLERLNLQHPAVPVPSTGAKACIKPHAKTTDQLAAMDAARAADRSLEALGLGAHLCRTHAPDASHVREIVKRTTPVLMHRAVPARAGIIDLVA